MTNFILPTAEIVREHKQYDHIFCFYDEGVKGIVRDCVLFSTGDIFGEEEQTEVVTERITQHYEQSLHLKYLENTHGTEYPSLIIELVTAQISRAIFTMMTTLFMHRLYEVSCDRWDWWGDDFITKVLFKGESLERQYTRHPHSGLLVPA